MFYNKNCLLLFLKRWDGAQSTILKVSKLYQDKNVFTPGKMFSSKFAMYMIAHRSKNCLLIKTRWNSTF